MQVDVVIPAFGRPQMVREAVQSVLEQTHHNLHLWIVDDASPEILSEQIQIHDSRLTVLRLEKNLGPAGARNCGAAAGQAPFIAFLDSDDLWHPEKIARQLAYFGENPQCQWVHTDETWLRNGEIVRQKPEHRKQGGQFLVRAFERCLIASSAVMLRRDFFQRHAGFAESFYICEDYELWLRLMAAEPIGFLAEPMAVKRAGAWEQLSATREIDRFRVLALHRFYRQARADRKLAEFIEPLLREAERKSALLLKGAKKYERVAGQKTYQAWLTLFSTRRTRDMRWSS